MSNKKLIYIGAGAVTLYWLYGRYNTYAFGGSGSGTGSGLLGSFGF